MTNNFMIGMYGGYDAVKFRRDFKESFYGIQACLFNDEKDIQLLSDIANEKGFAVGIHFPLRAGLSKVRDPQFLSRDAEARKEAYKTVENELEFIKQKQINVDYILFHYPKPVIVKEDFDMKSWKFADSSEYTFEADYPLNEFKEHSENLFKWLSEKSIEYAFTPILEFDALNKFILEDNFLEMLLKKYPAIKICLDTGRLHLQNKTDPNFNAIEIMTKFAKYTNLVHLWNIKVSEDVTHNHFPALPNLNPKEGWAPIQTYIEAIIKENPNTKIMFEHRSDQITDEELEICYAWISSLVNKKTP